MLITLHASIVEKKRQKERKLQKFKEKQIKLAQKLTIGSGKSYNDKKYEGKLPEYVEETQKGAKKGRYWVQFLRERELL